MGVAEPSAAAQGKNDKILHLGIDLGTFQSSIVSSTNLRRTVFSVVGWPKDLISYKFLQKQVVIGEECLSNRMAVDMVWPLEHGVFRHHPGGEDEEEGKEGNSREAEAVRHL